jgi:hypothetical protein
MTTLARNQFASAPAGQFEARIYLVGGPPDGDGDLILPNAVPDGHDVVVSYAEHDSVLADVPPVGTAKLFHVGRAVHAIGKTDDSIDGRKLANNLRQHGPSVMWSIAWHKPTLKSRAPTAAEIKEWPDARRVIEKWDAMEISPVAFGSCGPSCRTLNTKCGGCTCGGKGPPARPADLKEWLPSFEPCDQSHVAAIAIQAGMKKWGIKHAPTWRFFLPNNRCSGEYLPDRSEVWIQCGLDARETALVALHELRHHRQHERGELFTEGEPEGFARVLVRDLQREGLIS